MISDAVILCVWLIGIVCVQAGGAVLQRRHGAVSQLQRSPVCREERQDAVSGLSDGRSSEQLLHLDGEATQGPRSEAAVCSIAAKKKKSWLKRSPRMLFYWVMILIKEF